MRSPRTESDCRKKKHPGPETGRKPSNRSAPTGSPSEAERGGVLPGDGAVRALDRDRSASFDQKPNRWRDEDHVSRVWASGYVIKTEQLKSVHEGRESALGGRRDSSSQSRACKTTEER